MRDHGLTKEQHLQAAHDTRHIPEGRSVEANVIRHVQGDMDPEHISAAMKPERGFLGQIAEKIGQAWENLHIGDEHMKAMVKLGFHELTPLFQALPDSNIRPMEEPGVFGNETMPHLNPDDYGLSHYAHGNDRDNDRTR